MINRDAAAIGVEAGADIRRLYSDDRNIYLEGISRIARLAWLEKDSNCSGRLDFFVCALAPLAACTPYQSQ